MLYYGGLAGMAIVALASIVVVIRLSGSRRRLRKELDEIYGTTMEDV